MDVKPLTVRPILQFFPLWQKKNLGKGISSAMKEKTEELIKWSQSSKMLINCNKTKEMIIGKPKSDNIPLLQIDRRQIERVSHFKILGLQLSDNLLWDRNVDYICNKISSKLYFLKLLKRAGLSSDDLQYFYVTVIRPISVYACTVWNHNLTSTLSDQLESYQKEHRGLFMATKLKECLISIYSSWLIWNLKKTAEKKLANPSSRKFFPVTVLLAFSPPT